MAVENTKIHVTVGFSIFAVESTPTPRTTRSYRKRYKAGWMISIETPTTREGGGERVAGDLESMGGRKRSLEEEAPAMTSWQGTALKKNQLALAFAFRDRQEISWTIWGPSVLHIWSRPIERNHRRSCPTSRISRLRSDQRWGAIGHSKVQVISCRSLR